MKRTSFFLVLGFASLILVLHANVRPTLLFNAHILTLDPESSVADAMLLRGGNIVKVGTKEQILSNLPRFTRSLDMQGKTIVPGFIDAHSHFPSAGLTEAGVDMTPPPLGNVATLQILLNKVSEATGQLSMGEWIVGFNYDDSSMDVLRHPTRTELDQVAPNHPVYLWHRSGHMGVANSLALDALGFKDEVITQPNINSANPPDRDESDRLTGLLQEGAAPRMSFLLRQLALTRLYSSLLSARDQYLSAGITTAQNGFADNPSMWLLRWSQRLGIIPQRLVIWPAHDKVEKRLKLESSQPLLGPTEQLSAAIGWNSDPSIFAITAIKLVADGSPQGRTAWLTEPYMNDLANSEYRGAPTVSEQTFKSLVRGYHDAGFQLAMHGNGDAAIDLIIAAVAAAQAKNPREDARHLLVHGQLIRSDQLTQLADLGISATFFPSHVYYWGDWYRQVLLGAKRAKAISPLALAEQAGVRFSIHSDSPVTPISPMQVMWSATTRETLSGKSLGQELSISRERALRAMTIDAAWQSRLEHDRGSLEAGKFADFVVLSEDPLTYPDLRYIRIEQVWIDGQVEF